MSDFDSFSSLPTSICTICFSLPNRKQNRLRQQRPQPRLPPLPRPLRLPPLLHLAPRRTAAARTMKPVPRLLCWTLFRKACDRVPPTALRRLRSGRLPGALCRDLPTCWRRDSSLWCLLKCFDHLPPLSTIYHLFFHHFLSFSTIFKHFLPFSTIFHNFPPFSTIFHHFLPFTTIYSHVYHFLTFSTIFRNFLPFTTIFSTIFNNFTIIVQFFLSFSTIF